MRFLGYKRGEDGNLVIDEDEAVTMRKIYRLFLSGLIPNAVAKRCAMFLLWKNSKSQSAPKSRSPTTLQGARS